MKKIIGEIVKRGLLGVPIGITITYAIPFIISVCVGDGKFYPVVPAFVQQCTDELQAVGIQLCMGALMGFVFGSAGIVWKQERWSLALQTFVHFLLLCAGYIPAAWVCWWMNHTIKSVLIYIGIFSAVYVIIWIITITLQFSELKKINGKCGDNCDS